MSDQQPDLLSPARYRRRRATDAVRLLPVVGALLFLAPLLWARAPGGLGTANGGIYLFGVWVGLIAIAMVLARYLRRPDDAPEDPSGAGNEPGR